jgi:hypothetical protein
MKLLSKLALRAEDSLLVGIIIFYLKSYNFNAFALITYLLFCQYETFLKAPNYYHNSYGKSYIFLLGIKTRKTEIRIFLLSLNRYTIFN